MKTNMYVFDFYKENRESFEKKTQSESVLISGNHKAVAPLVTILIPTYKRVKLMREALESALNQLNSVDYQVIVVDNEGANIEEETETSIALKEYKDERIIYYRHKEQVSFKMDNAVKLAKSKWIVFLHDDDILHPNHLRVLTEVSKRYPKAKFISCPGIDFLDGNSAFNNSKYNNIKYQIRKKHRSANSLGYYPNWLGGLIDREAYISTGGMPSYSNSLGDYCMVQKFHYRYGIYELLSNIPLYYHRVWKGQASSSGNDFWTNLYKNEYEYFQYVNNKCHPLTHEFWDRICSYRIINKAKDMNLGIYKCNINLRELVENSQMSENGLLINDEYRRDVAKRVVYERLFDEMLTHTEKGEICL